MIPALMAQASDACANALAQLQRCVERCTEALALEMDYDKELVCHLAYLTKEVIAIMANLQKLDQDRPRTEVDDVHSLFP